MADIKNSLNNNQNSIINIVTEALGAEAQEYIVNQIVSGILSHYASMDAKLDKLLENKAFVENLTSQVNKAYNTKHPIEELLSSFEKHTVQPQLTTTLGEAPNFIGRKDETHELIEKLNKHKAIVVHGIGGIGKSSFVSAYLNTHKNEFKHYGFINWTDNIKLDFFNSLHINMKLEDYNNIDKNFDEVMKNLRALGGQKLLIIDKVEEKEINYKEEEKSIRDILNLTDTKNNYKIIFTSRFKINSLTPYFLKPLNEEDAKEIFLTHCKTKKIEKVYKILKYLGYHALFIELVAKTIKNEGYTLDDIIDKFERGELSKIEFIDEESGDELTFNQNLQELFSMQNLKDEYVLLLKRLSVLPSIDIELSFLEEVLGNERLKGRLNFLVGRGWLIENDGSYKLHQIIKEYIFSTHLPNFEEIASILDYYLALMANVDNPQVAINNRDKLQFFDAFIDGLKRVARENEKIGIYFNFLGAIYYHLGEYYKSELLFEKALKMHKKVSGGEHTSIATSYNNLAVLYKSKEEYDKAEPLYEKALEINKKVLGEEHPNTATSYNNLAGLYKSKGEYEKAEPLYEKALEINKKVLGEEHLSTATSYNNLAGIYASKGEYDKAEPRYEKSLEIQKKVLGEEHPYTAGSYNNLAGLYNSKEEYDKAESFFRKALEIQKKVLGEEYPYTATSYNNLGVFYYEQERIEEGYELMKRAVEIWSKILPANHPNLIDSKKGLEIMEKRL